jgi:uncharacterized protein (TIGR02757 family)
MVTTKNQSLPRSKAKSTIPDKKSDLPKDWLLLKPALERLVQEYKTPAYIKLDPIQFPYRYLDTDAQTVELVAFIAAMFSYGRREQVIVSLNKIFSRMGKAPLSYLEGFNLKQEKKHFESFVHRFNTGDDVLFLLSRLQSVYDRHGSLEALFTSFLPLQESQNLLGSASYLHADHFRSAIGKTIDTLLGPEMPERYGLRFLFAHPNRGGACKRFNMFLRWMVREDIEPSGRVDLGLWNKALHPRDLRIPLDAHVMNMNKQLQLTTRKDNSWKTAEEITDIFRLLCPEDPIRYDYALFGFSLDKRAITEILNH